MLNIMPFTKFVPAKDNVLETEEATIPTGDIEVIVGVVLPAVVVELLPPPQDMSPNVSVARPVIKPKLNK